VKLAFDYWAERMDMFLVNKGVRQLATPRT
jgi:hypothetical protein